MNLKKLFIYFVVINFTLITTYSFSQADQFKRVYTKYLITQNSESGETKNAVNTFVFNANNSTDIIWYKPNGSKETYTVIGNKITGTTEDGSDYQVFNMLNAKGDEIIFQYFSADNGLRILYDKNGNNKIEFLE
jgi:hypothetical protein